MWPKQITNRLNSQHLLLAILALTAALTLVTMLVSGGAIANNAPVAPAAAQPLPPTPTPGPTPTPPPPGCRNVLTNGDFESTGGWLTYSALSANVISGFPPPSGAYHSGTHGAYLADYNNAQDFVAHQINIPANATKAILQYWWQVESAESMVQPYDKMTVDVDLPLGHPVETINVISNQDAAPRWNVSAHNLLRYRGRTITVRWEARTDANRPTAFYLDDVSFLMCVGVSLNRHGYLPLVMR